MGIRFAVAKAGLDQLLVTTDEAIVVLMAKQILKGELPLVAMAQPCQFPLESYLMAPFVEKPGQFSQHEGYPLGPVHVVLVGNRPTWERSFTGWAQMIRSSVRTAL